MTAPAHDKRLMADAVMADADQPRLGGPHRVPVHVAVGVLINSRGEFLLTSRPAGKVYEGYWEFPGGKLEPGESVARALSRELHEELGLHVAPAAVESWRESQVDYPHALVHLHFCKVRSWQGEPEMREGQQLAWERLPVRVTPVLAGTVPVLRWLAQEQGLDDTALEKPS